MTGARPRAAQRALPRVVRRVATGLAVVAGGLGAFACGGGPPIPADDLSLRVVAGATDVRLGEPFPLTVVRVWSKRLVPAAWDERALAPLAVRLTSSVRREDDLRVEETRTYRAYAFSRADVVVAPPPLVARPTDGGAERRAAAVPLALKVRPALDPASPGAPELPDVPPPPPFPWAWGAAATVALAVVGAFLARRRARRAPEARPSDAVVGAPPPDAPAPDSVAVAALAAVEARTDADAAGRRRAAVEVTEIVRAYVAARFGVPTARRTSAEVLAAPFPADDAARAALRRVLACGDAVKFAEATPDAAARAAQLADARAFVGATAAEARP